MPVIDKFFIKLFCKLIGEDRFGNKYYESKKKDYLGKNRRLVVYKGELEPTLVPPPWHSWLHYMSDEIPSDNDKNLKDLIEYEPNLTGTNLAFDPSKNMSVRTEKYIRWEPK